MKYMLLFLCWLIALNSASAQNFKEQLDDFVSKNDTVAEFNLLQKWEKAATDEPELYVAFFNYYTRKSKQEIIRIDAGNPNSSEAFVITDSAEKPVGFLSGDVSYNADTLKKGFEYIDKGISKFPARLDMRFGKIYMLGQIGDYNNFTDEIVKTIEYSVPLRNKWLWINDKPVEEPMNNMLASVQEYINQLYNTENDSLLDNMKRISETVLKYYPDHIESMSNISIVYLLRKDYDKALNILFEAEKIAPNDYIILANIAQAYKMKGDKINAVKYYEKVVKYGDQETVKFALQQIELLKSE